MVLVTAVGRLFRRMGSGSVKQDQVRIFIIFRLEGCLEVRHMRSPLKHVID